MASSITVSSVREVKNSAGVVTQRVFVIGCVAHTDGTFTSTTLPYDFSGQLDLVTYAVGATPPTAASDLTILDNEGVDVLGAAGADKVTTTNSQFKPAIGSAAVSRPIVDNLTLAIAANIVNGATFTISLYVSY